MRRFAGFTLIELIMVIILLGIVATISVRFVALSTRGAIDVSDRQQRSLKGVVLSERLSRELRESVPGTVTVSDDGSCLSFVPALDGGFYREVIDENDGSVEYKPFTGFVLDQGEAVVASPSGGLTALKDLVDPSQQSPEKRFYVVDGSIVFFWLAGPSGSLGRLYRQVRSDRGDGCPGNTAEAQIMATDLRPSADESFFTSETPSIKSNSLINFNFVIDSRESDESLEFSQTLQVRNVP